jgi:hypothetical protein
MPDCEDEMTDIDGFLALAPQAIELAVRDGMGAVAGLPAETTGDDAWLAVTEVPDGGAIQGWLLSALPHDDIRYVRLSIG